MTRTLTIIGCGKVGQTLARLWHLNGKLVIGDVLNRSIDSAERAVQFIGAGHVVTSFNELLSADIVLIATPDDQIAACSEAIAASGRLTENSIVFHCSGALPSSILNKVNDAGAAVASIHPIRSFAQPVNVVQNFAGTYCGVEGEQRALQQLEPLFRHIGANLIAIDPEQKVLYHAAAVFASNYLVTLLDTAAQTYEKAGIPSKVGLKMMASLVRETVENVLEVGPEKALTGPIARGDVETVNRQYRAFKQSDARFASLYKRLGTLTAALAARRSQKE
jgi:predicted short-subunit dehydrogenase-like oxidoreductase (DUF2520 family)